MKTEKPILFSSEMVRAILNSTKTQTRRVVKPQPVSGVRFSPFVPGQVEDGHGQEMRCPYGVDRLWVRETWAENKVLPIADRPAGDYIYRADGVYSATWKPSIFMPRRASRITLKVVNVRVERLQEISESDCCLEMGCAVEWPGPGQEPYKRKLRTFFGILWDSINAKRGYGWDTNPWVWVVEFKKIEVQENADS